MEKVAKIFIDEINYIDGYIYFYKRFESTKPSPGPRRDLNMPLLFRGGITKEE